MTYAKMSKINFSTTGAVCSFRSVAGIASRRGSLQIFCSELSICDLTVQFQEIFIKIQRKNFRDKQKRNYVYWIKKKLHLVFRWKD